MASVAEHRTHVGDRFDFMHAMGNGQNRHAVIAQQAQDFEYLVDISRSQRGCCFVENENGRVLGQRLGDFDHLAPGKRQVAHQAAAD